MAEIDEVNRVNSLEKQRIITDFRMEIKIKDALIEKLSKSGSSSKDALTKLIKMIEHPRLVTLANKLLTAERLRKESPTG